MPDIHHEHDFFPTATMDILSGAFKWQCEPPAHEDGSGQCFAFKWVMPNVDHTLIPVEYPDESSDDYDTVMQEVPDIELDFPIAEADSDFLVALAHQIERVEGDLSLWITNQKEHDERFLPSQDWGATHSADAVRKLEDARRLVLDAAGHTIYKRKYKNA